MWNECILFVIESIVQTMFRADCIPYKVKPVCTYNDLESFNDEYEKENEGESVSVESVGMI